MAERRLDPRACRRAPNSSAPAAGPAPRLDASPLIASLPPENPPPISLVAGLVVEDRRVRCYGAHRPSKTTDARRWPRGVPMTDLDPPESVRRGTSPPIQFTCSDLRAAHRGSPSPADDDAAVLGLSRTIVEAPVGGDAEAMALADREAMDAAWRPRTRPRSSTIGPSAAAAWAGSIRR
ncbi:MAG: hypothetical protein R3B82_29885 [Sandaracinaceae bacterium]